ncbi:MAG: hypothetical protein QOK48_2947 [Blastocatellia bacterium]|jgi:hypothetical protein|nr:hypothetical protein [Blastocatellia bacterium]
MNVGSLIFSIAALIVSVLSFYFSIKSWRESNRPLVTARGLKAVATGFNISADVGLHNFPRGDPNERELDHNALVLPPGPRVNEQARVSQRRT